MKYLFLILIIAPLSCYSQLPTPEAEFTFDQTLEENFSGILPDTGSCIFNYSEDRFGNDNALGFSNGFLDYGNPSFSAMDTSDFSISCWVRPPSGAGNGTVTYLSKVDTANVGLTGSYYIVYSHFSSSFQFGLNFEDSTGTTLVANASGATDWLHIAITVDRSDSAKIYLNGVLAYESDIGASVGVPCFFANEHLTLASYITSQNARLDDLFFYKEVLSIADINDLYNEPNTASIIEEEMIDFSIFPNPVNDQNLNVFTGKEADYQLTNLAGQTILEGRLLEGSNVVDVSNFNSGVYFINMNYGNDQFVSKKVVL